MGVLNCQKCINPGKTIYNELLLDKNANNSRKIITSIENQNTNSTPQKFVKYINEEKINRFNINNKKLKKNKYKEIYLEIKNGNTDIIYDLDYNTLEIICNESDSYQDFREKEKNKQSNINIVDDNDLEEINEFQKILLSNEKEDLDINDFINQKIKENQDAEKIEYEKINPPNDDIIENPENYKIIYDKNMNDYKNNLNLKNFSDLELSDDNYNNNDINNKIIEEKEEYENEESSYNKLKELKYNSANLSQEKLRSIEINTKGKNSTKSENIKDKGNISLHNYNKNNSYNKQIIGKSVTSYEIESDNPNIESNNYNINKKKNQGDN